MIEDPISILLPGDVPLWMIKVRGGTFSFGKYEKALGLPTSISDFSIGQYPITNLQYSIFLNAYKADNIKEGKFAGQQMVFEHPWGMQKKMAEWVFTKGFEHHPVIHLTWFGAYEFCKWISQLTGENYNLPSAVQWEYAARGGCKSLGFSYAGSFKMKEVGWFRLNSNAETKAIGLKLPNELGIYDMSGNIWERCRGHTNIRSKVPGEASSSHDSRKPTESLASRVVRGGSWGSYGVLCHVSSGANYNIDFKSSSIGFRVVRY